MDPERRETDPGTHEKMCCLPGLGGCVGMWTWETWGGGPSQGPRGPLGLAQPVPVLSVYVFPCCGSRRVGVGGKWLERQMGSGCSSL